MPSKTLCGLDDLHTPLGVPPFHKKTVLLQPSLETLLSLTSSEHLQFVLHYWLVSDCPHHVRLSQSERLVGTIIPILWRIKPSTFSRRTWKKGGNTEYNVFLCSPIVTQLCYTEMKYPTNSLQLSSRHSSWRSQARGIQALLTFTETFNTRLNPRRYITG